MIRLALIDRYGGPETIRVVDQEVPQPAAGQVRIAVEASSLAFTDLLIRRNLYPMLRERPPLTLGYSFVGRIDALGEGVSGYRVGDRVAALTQVGSNADLIVRPADTLVRVPNAVDAAEAETLVLSGATAYQALTRYRTLKPGQRVLVTGASGAVGHLAGQLCRHMGLHWYGVCSDQNRSIVEEAGGVALPYDTADGQARLEVETGTGFDMVLELANAEPLRVARGRLKDAGTLVFLGMRGAWSPSAADRKIGLRDRLPLITTFGLAAMATRARRRRVAIYSIADRRRAKPEEYREDLSALFTLLAEGNLRPHIAERIQLEDIQRGHHMLEREKVRGRLVVVHDPK